MVKIDKKTATPTLNTSPRYGQLKAMLDERYDRILQDVQGRIRGVRAEGAERPHEGDPGETAELDIQEDVELAVIQLQAETLDKVKQALARLDEGRYGLCDECGGEIPEARLRALPFAVRCRDCEEAREAAIRRERMMSRRWSSSVLDI